MSVTVVYCPDCGHGFYQRNGVAASVMWAEHYAKDHGSADPSSTCSRCGVTVTDQTPSAFYSAHDERCGGALSEPADLSSTNPKESQCLT